MLVTGHRVQENDETESLRGQVLWDMGMLMTGLWAGTENMGRYWRTQNVIDKRWSKWVLGTWGPGVWVGIEGTGRSSIPSPETLPFPSVTQPKRTFTTVRTPKDIASENSISRSVANPWSPLLWDI